MPTQTKAPLNESIDKAAERVAELNEKAVENGKKAGVAYLGSYEKAVLTLVDSYEKAAGATKVEWIGTAAATQATLTRDFTTAFTAAARELVS